jgi:hypothetical protein
VPKGYPGSLSTWRPPLGGSRKRGQRPLYQAATYACSMRSGARSSSRTLAVLEHDDRRPGFVRPALASVQPPGHDEPWRYCLAAFMQIPGCRSRMTFATPLKLTAGTYWIGTISGARTCAGLGTPTQADDPKSTEPPSASTPRNVELMPASPARLRVGSSLPDQGIEDKTFPYLGGPKRRK